ISFPFRDGRFFYFRDFRYNGLVYFSPRDLLRQGGENLVAVPFNFKKTHKGLFFSPAECGQAFSLRP
ncbi:MAG: hypothetical protein IIW39_04410, partial [Clostridia bacterium]|nr:hypothetical protein [Clostridia bacterium]